MKKIGPIKKKQKPLCPIGSIPLWLHGSDKTHMFCVKDYRAYFNERIKK